MGTQPVDYTSLSLPDSTAPVIAVDAVPFHRSHAVSPDEVKTFHGHLATAISVDQPEVFVRAYQEILDRTCAETGLDRIRAIYKAYDIRQALGGHRIEIEKFFFLFARKLLALPSIRVTGISCSFDVALLHKWVDLPLSGDAESDFKESKVVPVYGREPGREYVSISSFLNLIADSFPVIAAWRLTEVTGIYNRHFLLDGFPNHVSKAWDELSGRNRVDLVPHGDACNPMLSAADLLCASIDRQLDRQRLRLSSRGVFEVLKALGGEALAAEIHSLSVSNEQIDSIAPYSRAPISKARYIRHPVTFLISEAEDAHQRYEVESSPLMRRVRERAYNTGGSYLLYEAKTSPTILCGDDCVIAYGPKGVDTIRRLRSLGYSFKDEVVGEGPPLEPSPQT